MTYTEMRDQHILNARFTEGFTRVHHFLGPATLRTSFRSRPHSQPNTLALDAEAQQRERDQNRKHFA